MSYLSVHYKMSFKLFVLDHNKILLGNHPCSFKYFHYWFFPGIQLIKEMDF